MKKKIGTNTRTILTFLAKAGPTTRVELLSLVKPEWASPTWGNTFFLPGPGGNGVKASLMVRGFVTKVGQLGRRGVYAITPKGLAALEK